MNHQMIIELIEKIGYEIIKNKEYLTDLDSAIGDGDHGINLARGFGAVTKRLPDLWEKDIGAIFRTTGLTLVSTVGGASGPLYGSAFLKAGAKLSGKYELTMEDFLLAFLEAIEGVKMRGKSVQGEKTMLDAMIPAKEAMNRAWSEKQSSKECCLAGVAGARQGLEYTKTIIATKGRASYLGERSLGHIDPGAASFTIMLETIAENVS